MGLELRPRIARRTVAFEDRLLRHQAMSEALTGGETDLSPCVNIVNRAAAEADEMVVRALCVRVVAHASLARLDLPHLSERHQFIQGVVDRPSVDLRHLQ